MALADPVAELIRLVTGPGDPPPAVADAADRRRAELLRRRFGLALPPPFVGPPGREEPIRVATAVDGPAIAAVKWRVFGTNYRGGVMPDHFLDARDVVPPPSFWTGRAMLPPSRRHRLLVWGRPGAVFGYVDTGPVHPDDLDPRRTSTGPGGRPDAAGAGDAAGAADAGGAGGPGDDPGEVYELYVDPTAQGVGGGGRLLAEAEAWLGGAGFTRAELSVLAGNDPAQHFYRAHGWGPTGRVVHVDLGVVAFEEVRFGRPLGAGGS